MPIRYADSFDVLTHDDFKAWMGDTLAPAPMVCRLKEGTFTIDGFHDRFQACCNTNAKRSVSGLHFDNHKHEDVVATVTLSGRAIVTLERTAPDAPPARFEQCAWDFYMLYGVGLSNGKHAVVRADRSSITMRFVLA